MKYYSFASWDELIAHVRAGGSVFYHAPLDYRPRRVYVTKVFKNGKLRVLPALPTSADKFTADRAHLERFRRGTA